MELNINSPSYYKTHYGIDDDICAREAHFYRNAKEWGLQDCFAKVEFIGYYERDVWFYDLREVQDLIFEYIEDFDDKLRAVVEENGLSIRKQQNLPSKKPALRSRP